MDRGERGPKSPGLGWSGANSVVGGFGGGVGTNAAVADHQSERNYSRTMFNTYVAKLPTIRQEVAPQAQAPEEEALPGTYETGGSHAA